MNLSQMQRFQALADTTLADLFPATIILAGQTYAASGVGGRGLDDYMDGGRSILGERFFRLSKTLLVTPPAIGVQVTWAGSDRTEEFTLKECPDRPHETSWMLRCEPKKR